MANKRKIISNVLIISKNGFNTSLYKLIMSNSSIDCSKLSDTLIFKNKYNEDIFPESSLMPYIIRN